MSIGPLSILSVQPHAILALLSAAACSAINAPCSAVSRVAFVRFLPRRACVRREVVLVARPSRSVGRQSPSGAEVLPTQLLLPAAAKNQNRNQLDSIDSKHVSRLMLECLARLERLEGVRPPRGRRRRPLDLPPARLAVELNSDGVDTPWRARGKQTEVEDRDAKFKLV